MSRRTFIIVVVVGVALVGLWSLGSPASEKNTDNNSSTVRTLQDAHGLAVDRKDSSKVYIATHTGLMMMQNDGALQNLSTAQDDYMGFSAHPTDPNTFYSSGHPSRGGNLGFQKSIDGGETWQKVSNGVNGPVDFHALAVSQTDPTIVYGLHAGRLQRSSDEGKSWELIDTNLGSVIALATCTKMRDMVYAGTTAGLYVSQDRGQTWAKLEATSDPVVAVSVNPKDEKEIIVSTQKQGLMLSNDSGKTWSTSEGYTGGMVMHIAYDYQDPATMYLINQDLEIYKSTDSGKYWQKIL